MEPFLTLSGFTALWDGPALTSQQQGVTNLLLKVASKWIYDRVSGISSTDPTAQIVVLEVVSNVLRYGKYAPLSNYSRTTAHRMEAGTLASEVMTYFTDNHKLLLGIPLRSPPMTSCRPNDFMAQDQDQGWPTPWSNSFGNVGYDYWSYDD